MSTRAAIGTPADSAAAQDARRAAAHAAGTRHDPAYFQQERYAGTRARSRLLPIYYACKPAIPRRAQLAMRRRYAGRQRRRAFPAWPIEPVLVEMRERELRERLRQEATSRIPLLNYWPGRRRFAFTLTHDVETARGIEGIEALLTVEQRHGFVSCWNFVAEDYAIPSATFERLRSARCEIGLHGITHDGKLFQSRQRFEADLPKIRDYLAGWQAVGFRSPATHRRAEWMHELCCLYDSSFPDTDPFEPQSGGCCSILPFHLGGVVELPITLVQDHTLFDILGERTTALWRQKSEWLIRHHGLINLITHPDYMVAPERLARYEELLDFLAAHRDGWHALPREIAAWWNTRSGLRCVQAGERPRIEGPGSDRAGVAWARERDGQIHIET